MIEVTPCLPWPLYIQRYVQHTHTYTCTQHADTTHNGACKCINTHGHTRHRQKRPGMYRETSNSFSRTEEVAACRHLVRHAEPRWCLCDRVAHAPDWGVYAREARCSGGKRLEALHISSRPLLEDVWTLKVLSDLMLSSVYIYM